MVGDEPGQWRDLPSPLDAPSPPEFAGHAKDWLWLGGSIWTRLDKIIEIDMGPAGEASAEVDTSYDAGRRQELIDKAAESRPGYRV